MCLEPQGKNRGKSRRSGSLYIAARRRAGKEEASGTHNQGIGNHREKNETIGDAFMKNRLKRAQQQKKISLGWNEQKNLHSPACCGRR